MQLIMLRRGFYGACLAGLAAALTACGGGGGGYGTSSTAQPTATGTVPLAISDASSDNWATVGVRVLSIALLPQGGGSAVTVWNAPSPAPYVNLEQLDQLGELLGNVSVPVGTYTAAVLTISANPGDVLLITAPDPDPGFPVAGGTSIPADQIVIQNTQGGSGNLTTNVTVDFASALTVSTSQSDALDLEFDLAHPAFIMGHTVGNATLWAVNFSAPLLPRPMPDFTHFVLRHTYGQVTAPASAGPLTITKDYPVLPVTNPETDIASTVMLNIAADSTNGTIVFDLDSPGTPGVVVNSFTTCTSPCSASAIAAGQIPMDDFVRIAIRYQEGGTLTAIRVYYSSSFNTVWWNPEGHVLAVNPVTNTLWVTTDEGTAVPVSVTADTAVYFHSGATSIGSATTLLANQQIVRGFKVDVTPVPGSNPLQLPVEAQSLDIEAAAFGGAIPATSTTSTPTCTEGGITYAPKFRTAGDDYDLSLCLIASVANDNTDPEGNLITGFDWWDLTFPTTSSTNVANFFAAVGGGVNFGAPLGTLTAYGASRADWGDGGSNTSNWYLRDAVLLPTPVPLGAVSMPYDQTTNTFAMTVDGGTPVTMDVSATMGSATLVYNFDRSPGNVTLTPIDITQPGGMADLVAALSVMGAPVKVYGVPQDDGSLKVYLLVYFTGTLPTL